MEMDKYELHDEYTNGIDEDVIPNQPKVQHANSDTRADVTYKEMEEKSYMIKSEDLKCNEDILWIWGFKFPTKKAEANKAIHHGLLLINAMANKGCFRIAYFHSDVKGAGNKIPKMIKKMCKKMTADMRMNLTSFDIVHPNFSLKWALFFFDKFTFTDYKIHFIDRLEDIYDQLEIDQKTFVMGVIPCEVKIRDHDGNNDGKSVVSNTKVISKMVVYTSDLKYKDFDITTAVKTYDIYKKHISEFARDEGDMIPDVFNVIFSYFERNEKHMKAEGIFRLAGNKETMKDIENHLFDGDYFYLGNIEDPLTVAVFLKKVLREMGEPLCTFDAYIRFKDINDETWSWIGEKVERAYKLVDNLPVLNRDTFRALLSFLNTLTLYSEDNKMRANNLAIVFAPNIFTAYEVTPNDMIYAQVLVKTLTLMITNYHSHT
jgi:hypothetical protein